MGTSKAYGGMTGNPNWTELSNRVTRACSTGNIPEEKFDSITQSFTKLIGGSSSAGRGRSKIAGKAGIRTAQRLGKFLSDVKSQSFVIAISNLGFRISSTTTANDAINFILEHTFGVASLHDDVAAKAAERQLLEEIQSDATTIEELEQRFSEKIEEYGIEELLIRFYALYIYEHLSIDFEEKLVKEKKREATNNFYRQLKNYLFEKVKCVSHKRDLSEIDWTSDSGKDLVTNIFEDTIKAFEDYES